MAFEAPFGGYRIEQPSLRISRTADRYGPTPWSGLSGSGGGFGVPGLGATNHQNSELPAQAGRVTTQISALKGLLDQINSALSQYGPVLQSDPTGVGVLGNAQGAASTVQSAIDQLSAVLPQVQQNYGSFQGSTDAWNAADQVLQSTSNVLASNRGVVAALSSAAVKAQQAQTTASSQAAASQQAASQAVTTALLQAQTLSGSGNFDGAIAALQAPNVIAAAQMLGRSGDIQSALAAISGQKQQAGAAADLRTQAQQCATQGGAWTGTFCDMTQARLAQQQLAQQKAQCAAQGGTWNADANYCDLSAKIAADRQAQIDAANLARQQQLDAQNAQLQQQTQLQQAQLAQQQAQFEAQQAATERQGQLAQQQAQAQVAAQAAQACINRGGNFDPATGACDLSFVQSQQLADKQSQQIMALMPFLATNPALLAQAVAKILGLDPGTMTGGVPGGGGGQPASIQAAGGQYSNQWGAESF